MPDLIEKDVPYEILFRLNEDGSVRGAHVQNLSIIEVGDRRLKEEIGPALPLDTADFPTSAIMTDFAKANAAESIAARAQIAALNGQIVKLQGINNALSDQIAALRVELADAKAPL